MFTTLMTVAEAVEICVRRMQARVTESPTGTHPVLDETNRLPAFQTASSARASLVSMGKPAAPNSGAFGGTDVVLIATLSLERKTFPADGWPVIEYSAAVDPPLSGRATM
jgi:hypothetical protein